MMRARVLFVTLASCLILAPVSLAQKAFTLFEQTYPIEGQAGIRVNVSDADITMATGSDNKLHVEVQVVARNQKRAQRHYDVQKISVKQNGSTYEVTDTPVDPSNDPTTIIRTTWRGLPQVHVILTAPQAVDVRVRTTDGDIRLGNRDGDVYLRTVDGDILTERLAGVMFEATTSDGDIVVESAEFKNVVIGTSDGDIVVEYADAEEVTATTSDGDIHFGELDGNAYLSTRDGDVYVGTLTTSSGRIRSSDGDIVLDAVEGELTGMTSDGDVVADLVRFDAVDLHSSDGDIVVSIPTDYGAELNLKGSEVSLDCCASFKGTKIKDYVLGSIHGSGASLKLTSSDGTVVLRER